MSSVADLIRYLAGLLGAALGKTLFVFLGMAMFQNALKRFGNTASFRYRYVLPSTVIFYMILTATLSEKTMEIIGIAVFLTFILSTLFFLTSLVVPKQHRKKIHTATSTTDGIDKDFSISFRSFLNASERTKEHIKKGKTYKMKLRQTIISAAIGIAALMVVFPPWVHRFRGIARDRGYSFLFALGGYREIDFPVLFVQWCLVALIAGGIIYYIKNRESANIQTEPSRPPFIRASNQTYESDIDMDEFNKLLDTFDKTKSKGPMSTPPL